MTDSEILSYFESNLDGMLKDLQAMVLHESPSSDKNLLVECSDLISSIIRERTSLVTENYPLEGTGPVLIARSAKKSEKKPVLLLCHYDTVHPKGRIQVMPFQNNGKVLTGPGVFDMKYGIVEGIWAVKYLLDNGFTSFPVTIMLTPDEEIGSTRSRPLIEKEAKKSSYVVVLEPSLSGNIKTRRKGVGRYEIQTVGLAAHSGIEPEKGASAVNELARTILDLEGYADMKKGTTINVGLIGGGSAVNVVPEKAWAIVDVRVWTNEEAARIETAFAGIRSHDPKVNIDVRGGMNRPPLVPSAKSKQLAETVKGLGKHFGLDINEAEVGGGSDANLISPLGIPVLDGMGADGGGAHAITEFIRIESIPARTAVLTALLTTKIE